MAMYNSSTLSNQDDPDVTLISHSFFYNQPTTTNSANDPNSRTYLNDKYNHASDIDPRFDAAKQIKQILYYYQKELKQESSTQLDCNRKLITRLFDFIRPVYSSYEKKMNDLNVLFEEISDLQDIRFIQQKEKTERLNDEILHLKKLIITSANDGNSSNNTLTKIYRINAMVKYEQWMEMEEETRKLSNLVELQRDRIDELVQLLSHQETSSLQTSASRNIVIPLDVTPAGRQQSAASNANISSAHMTTARPFSNRQEDSGTDTLQRSTNEFHTFGTLHIHSLTDFVTKTLIDTGHNETHIDTRPTLATYTLPSLSRISSYNDMKKCPICNYVFLLTANEFEIIHHVETCLISAGINDPGVPTEPKQYECPNCVRQFPGHEEKAYLQHLTDCFAEHIETF